MDFVAVLPDSTLIRIYCIYSNFVLSCAIVTAPFLVYVILTKSKSLGSYKWIVLNHAVATFVLTVVVNTTKMVILTPHLSGYRAGMFSFGDFRLSLLLLAAILCLSINVIIAIVLAFCNRYLVVFPGILNSLVRSKYFVIAIVVLGFAFQIIIVVSFVPMFHREKNDVLKMALERNKSLAPFFNIDSFFVITRELLDATMLMALVMIVILFVGGVAIAALFAFEMHRARRLNKLQHALLMCSLRQFFNAVVFLYIPFGFMLTCIRFHFSDTAPVMAVLMMFIGSGGMADMLTMFFTIVPYRRFLLKLWNQKIRLRSTQQSPLLSIS